MKRDFLKGLGIEDKDIIDKIMDENSADIGKAKGDLEDVKNQLTSTTNELNNLKDATKDYESLKNQVTQLTTDKTNLQNELTTKVAQIQKAHAIEGGVRDAKAKNVKAVMALLDMEKITYENDELKGLTDQLDALTKGEDTAFLFGEAQASSPAGTQPNNPPSNGGNGGNAPTGKSFADAVAAALNSNK
jgi:archaellum component FlaC